MNNLVSSAKCDLRYHNSKNTALEIVNSNMYLIHKSNPYNDCVTENLEQIKQEILFLKSVLKIFSFHICQGTLCTWTILHTFLV